MKQKTSFELAQPQKIHFIKRRIIGSQQVNKYELVLEIVGWDESLSGKPTKVFFRG